MAARGLNQEGARLHQEGQFRAASDRFLRALEHDPQNADAYYNLAANLHRVAKSTGNQAEYAQAESLYNQCLDRDGDHPECYRGLAVLLVETGRTDAAFRLLQGWISRSPTVPDARIEMARLVEEQGNSQQAKEHLLAALQMQPNNARALSALGKLRETTGEHMEALALYERSLAVNQFQPLVAARVASLQAALGGAAIARPTASGTRTVRGPGSATWDRDRY